MCVWGVGSENISNRHSLSVTFSIHALKKEKNLIAKLALQTQHILIEANNEFNDKLNTQYFAYGEDIFLIWFHVETLSLDEIN